MFFNFTDTVADDSTGYIGTVAESISAELVNRPRNINGGDAQAIIESICAEGGQAFRKNQFTELHCGAVGKSCAANTGNSIRNIQICHLITIIECIISDADDVIRIIDFSEALHILEAVGWNGIAAGNRNCSKIGGDTVFISRIKT